MVLMPPDGYYGAIHQQGVVTTIGVIHPPATVVTIRSHSHKAIFNLVTWLQLRCFFFNERLYGHKNLQSHLAFTTVRGQGSQRNFGCSHTVTGKNSRSHFCEQYTALMVAITP